MRWFFLTICFFLTAISLGSATSLIADDATIADPGTTVMIDILLDEASGGLSGYNITVELDNPGIADIVEVSYPSWATIHENSYLPSDDCWIMAVDLSSNVEGGSTDILLATVTIRGDGAGSTNLLVSPVQIDDDTGGVISTDPDEALIIVEGSVPPPPSNTSFEVMLGDGWCIFSTPIALEPDKATFETIFDPESQEAIRAIIMWDEDHWIVPTKNYRLQPLDAVYVIVKEGSTARAVLVPSSGVTTPPQKELVAGLNLIGPAPPHDESGFTELSLDQMLISIEEASGGLTGYVMVISPPHGQPSWSYGRGGTIQDMLPYKGYWVVMENPDTLYGFSTTPI